MDIKSKLAELREFVHAEHEANMSQLTEVWEKSLAGKVKSGETQTIDKLVLKNKNTLWATLGQGESRFREGDMICLHSGDAVKNRFIRQARIEAEHEGMWLLSGLNFEEGLNNFSNGRCYADPDGMDLTLFFIKALEEIAVSKIGREVILPLLCKQLNIQDCYHDNFDNAADLAESWGLNLKQQDAVGFGVAAKYVACIQGPPGTGKTKVISLIAKILTDEGQSVLLTSHTHMAINNALNKIKKEVDAVIKVGSLSTDNGLDPDVKIFKRGDDWADRPSQGYVIGATPFATCTKRLESFEFDTVIFDEASQITVPLAIMAMRKAKRFVFVGDHRQLPPVVLSKSILDKTSSAIFTQLIESASETSVMLNETYRMNQWLSEWPSKTYYESNLVSTGDNKEKRLNLSNPASQFKSLLSGEHPFIYMQSPGAGYRTSNKEEACLVKTIIVDLLNADMKPSDIGIVTPFRNHARTLKSALRDEFGSDIANNIVTDTVERMQGQEREIIIISLCATDPLFIKNIAAFLFQPERLNVAITRPISTLILIGAKLEENFSSDNEEVDDWISQYHSLIAHSYHHIIGEV